MNETDIKDLTFEQRADLFRKGLQQLMQEYGIGLKPEPSLRPQIDGSFTIAVSLAVVDLTKK